ncbi:hypothetical protein CCP2SC5_1100001 [Azospirillaceae bacterium]
MAFDKVGTGERLPETNLLDATVQRELSEIGQSLTANGDILIYGCDIARGTTGQRFINSIAALTHKDIMASIDATGETGKGGNWTLESSTDSSRESLQENIFKSSTYDHYDHTLATYYGGYVTSTATSSVYLIQSYIDSNGDVYDALNKDGSILIYKHTISNGGWSLVTTLQPASSFISELNGYNDIGFAVDSSHNIHLAFAGYKLVNSSDGNPFSMQKGIYYSSYNGTSWSSVATLDSQTLPSVFTKALDRWVTPFIQIDNSGHIDIAYQKYIKDNGNQQIYIRTDNGAGGFTSSTVYDASEEVNLKYLLKNQSGELAVVYSRTQSNDIYTATSSNWSLSTLSLDNSTSSYYYTMYGASYDANHHINVLYNDDSYSTYGFGVISNESGSWSTPINSLIVDDGTTPRHSLPIPLATASNIYVDSEGDKFFIALESDDLSDPVNFPYKYFIYGQQNGSSTWVKGYTNIAELNNTINSGDVSSTYFSIQGTASNLLIQSIDSTNHTARYLEGLQSDFVAFTNTTSNTAPSLSGNGRSPYDVSGGAPVDLFDGVHASTNDSGQTFTGLTLTASNVTDSGESLTIGGVNVALVNGTNVTLPTGDGSASVSINNNTATITITGMSLNDADMSALIDRITYHNNTPSPSTATPRTISITQITESGSNTNSATPNLAATITVKNGPTSAFFRATNGVDGYELWGYNETTGRYTMLVDLNPILGGNNRANGVNAGNGQIMAQYNGKLYFSGSDGSKLGNLGNPFCELYSFDGRSVSLVSDIYGSGGGSNPSSLFVWNNKLYFVATTAANGRELYSYNGTGSPTRISDLASGSDDGLGASSQMVAFDGALFFTDKNGGLQKLTTSGNISTVEARNVGNLQVASGKLWFQVDVTGSTGYALQHLSSASATPTTYGPTYAVNYVIGSDGTYIYAITNNQVSTGGSYGLYKTNGVTSTTLWSGAAALSASSTIVINGNVYIATDPGYGDPNSGAEITQYNPTNNTLSLLKDINPGSGSSITTNTSFSLYNGRVYFQASNGSSGRELWVTDGATNGTTQVLDINPTGDGFNGSVGGPSFLGFSGDVAPILRGINPISYNAGDSAKNIASQISIIDIDQENLVGASVRISSGLQSGDALHFTNMLGITGNYDSSTGVLTLTGEATQQNYQTALRSITFTSSAALATPRTIIISADDGTLTSLDSIVSVNGPVVSTTSSVLSESPASAITATAADPGITITSTNQNWNNGRLDVQITRNAARTTNGSGNTDTLALPTTGSGIVYSGGFVYRDGVNGAIIGAAAVGSVIGGGKLTITLNANATDADVQKIAKAITYSNSAATNQSRTVTFTATDGNGAVGSGIRTIVTGVAITSIEVPSNNTYHSGQNLDITVRYSDAVVVTGAPFISLALDNGVVNAAYNAGASTSTSLVFRYTVGANDSDIDGIIVNPSITLNGGGIKNGASNVSEIFPTPVPSTSGVLVSNTTNTPPTLTNVSTLTNGTEDVAYQITYAALAAAGNEADADNDAISFRVETVSTGALYTNATLTTQVTAGTTLLSSGDSWYWMPATNASGADLNAFTIKAWDGTETSTTATQVKINLTEQNDAPLLENTASPTLGSVNQAQVNAPTNGSISGGVLVSDLIDNGGPINNFSDVDSNSTVGIAIIGTDTSHGLWHYTIDGGANWSAVGAVNDSGNALLLSANANTRLYFQSSSATYSGSINNGITFRAWDGSSGTAGNKVSTSSTGGATAFSTAYDTVSLTISDTTPPDITINGVDISNDTGASDSDFVTKIAAQTITATLSASLASGDILYGSINGGSSWIDITSKVSGTSVSWDGVTLSSGVSAIEFKVTDSAGNDGTASSQNVTLDVTAPTIAISGIDISSDTGTSDSDFITNTASQTITATLSASLASGDTLYGSIDGGATWTNITSKVSGTSISWDGVTLSSGANAIKFKVTDSAGNDGTPETQSVTLNATLATISGIDISNDTGTSNSDFITKIAAQTITATLSASLGSGDILYGSIDGGSSWTDITSKVSGTFVSWDGVTLSSGASAIEFKVTDSSANDGTVATQNVTLDTTAPTINGIDISNDTGTSESDFVTKTATQTITATLSAALASGDTLYGSIDGGATWINITSKVSGTSVSWDGVTLSSGANTIEFKVTDSAGNEGTPETQSVTLDMTAPAITVSGIDISNDTGTSESDFITKTAAQTITATLSAALASGDILYGSIDGGASWINITSKVSGTSISWDGVTLSSSVSAIEFKVTDSAGNDGTSQSQSVTLDTTAPFVTIGSIDVSSDTGTSESDFITKTAAQTITATLSAALTSGDILYGSIDGGASWINITSKVSGTSISWDGVTLSSSVSAIEFKVTDSAGNDGTSQSQSVTLDTTAPAITIGSIDISSDTGTSDSDFVTNTPSQTITATLSASLASGDILYGSIDGGATWTNVTSKVSGTSISWNGVSLASGANTIEFKVTDSAGNNGTAATQNAALDITPPGIASVTIPATTMKVGSVVTATITVTNDADNYTTGNGRLSGTIGGFALTNFTRISNTQYTAQFTVTEGGNNIPSNNEIPVSLNITDSLGNISTDFETAISQSGDIIDANTPNITSASFNITSGSIGIGGRVTLTVTADESGYTLDPSSTINGQTISSFHDNGDGTYDITYVAAQSHDSVANDAQIPVNIIFRDSSGNVSAPYTTSPSAEESPAIDTSPPNAPTISSPTAGIHFPSSTTSTIIGGTTEPNATVFLYKDGELVATVVANASGAWSTTVTGLSEGQQSFSVKAADTAGNIGEFSTILQVTVDESSKNNASQQQSEVVYIPQQNQSTVPRPFERASESASLLETSTNRNASTTQTSGTETDGKKVNANATSLSNTDNNAGNANTNATSLSNTDNNGKNANTNATSLNNTSAGSKDASFGYSSSGFTSGFSNRSGSGLGGNGLRTLGGLGGNGLGIPGGLGNRSGGPTETPSNSITVEQRPASQQNQQQNQTQRPTSRNNNQQDQQNNTQNTPPPQQDQQQKRQPVEQEQNNQESPSPSPQGGLFDANQNFASVFSSGALSFSDQVFVVSNQFDVHRMQIAKALAALPTPPSSHLAA